MKSTQATRARRSVHFVPGPNEKMLAKSLASDADTLVIDLEDAVAPADKDDARQVIGDWLKEVDFGRKEVAIRLNPLDTRWGLEDLSVLLETPPHLFMIPKAERLSDLRVLESLIVKHEFHRSDSCESVGLLPICGETPRGLKLLDTIASEPRVKAITWGAEDLAAAVGSSSNRDSHGKYLNLFDEGRNHTLLAASAHEVQPIDTVYVQLNDEVGLREECEHVAQLGFTGKLTIHPDQIPVVNEAFTPTAEAIAQAERLTEAFLEAQRNGQNAFRFEGQMVDAPHLHRAKSLLRRVAEMHDR